VRHNIDMKAIEAATSAILIAIGEDPSREGLRDTPARVARWWQEFMLRERESSWTSFSAEKTDQVVVVSGIRVWSLCEHHLLPFSCDLTVGYLCRKKVIGLSKIPRVCHLFASRLQLQERMVEQIADEVERMTESEDVAVIGSGRHLCCLIRGVKTDAVMHTSAIRGRFRDAVIRQEFFALAQGQQGQA